MPPSKRANHADLDCDSPAGPQALNHAAGTTAITDDSAEIDRYDTESTLYLIVEDGITGGHLGSVRLLPTNAPHRLADRFAHLCEPAPPCDPAIFEITRMVTRPGLPPEAAERVRQQLSVALVEFALARGIAGFTMVTRMASLAALLAIGWDCEPLGMPGEIDGVAVTAVRINVDAATLVRLRDQYGFVEPLLRFDLSRSALVA